MPLQKKPEAPSNPCGRRRPALLKSFGALGARPPAPRPLQFEIRPFEGLQSPPSRRPAPTNGAGRGEARSHMPPSTFSVSASLVRAETPSELPILSARRKLEGHGRGGGRGEAGGWGTLSDSRRPPVPLP